MLKRFISRAIFLSSALSLAPLANAGKEDFKLPIEIGSNTQFVDGKLKTSVFKDDVQVRQGTLSIDADELRIDAAAGQGKEVYTALGSPAVYSQTMDDGGQITAKANEIRYVVENRTLELRGNAELIQDASMVKGEKISFNLEKEQLIAGGDEQKGRVTTVFQTEDID